MGMVYTRSKLKTKNKNMKTKTKANIIIAVISIFLIFLGIANLTAQVDTTAHCVTPDQIGDVINTGVAILDATHNTIIPNVDNSITGGFITAIALLIVRILEKRKLRKKGKLKDEKNNSVYHE
jgi:branched-subunit amino acid permease